MAKLIIMRSEETVSEIELDRPRITIGRHPHSNIMLPHPAVSGQHAAISLDLNAAFIDDLGSTNGTFINGRRVTRQVLEDGDSVTIALYQLRFIAGPSTLPAVGRIHVVNGPHAGKSVVLSKPLTTLGKPGSAVLAITRTGKTYAAAAIEGQPSVNGTMLTADARTLQDGDQIDLAGTQMTFDTKAGDFLV